MDIAILHQLQTHQNCWVGINCQWWCSSNIHQFLYHLRSPALLFLSKSIFREHRGKVTSADVSIDGQFALTTSVDGGAIVWNVPSMTRAHLLRCTASVVQGRLHPNNVHAVTLSSDNKLAYWDTVTGDMIRSIQLSTSGHLTCMDLTRDGMFICIGADDSSVRVIRYNEADTVRSGKT